MECTLDYIPERLHTNDKPIIEKFAIGEELYYRCKSDECSKPYDKISLYDISHNRNFCNNQEYRRDDVLYNIIENDQRQQYQNFDTTVLKIQSLQDNTTYFKEIVSQENPDLSVTIKLIHDPIPCMYPHSVFEVSVNGDTINSENYNSLLNKKNRTFKNLRSDIRQELTSIIQTGLIDSSKDIEYLEEP